jgi:hypothetical protein
MPTAAVAAMTVARTVVWSQDAIVVSFLPFQPAFAEFVGR